MGLVAIAAVDMTVARSLCPCLSSFDTGLFDGDGAAGDASVEIQILRRRMRECEKSEKRKKNVKN